MQKGFKKYNFSVITTFNYYLKLEYIYIIYMYLTFYRLLKNMSYEILNKVPAWKLEENVYLQESINWILVKSCENKDFCFEV